MAPRKASISCKQIKCRSVCYIRQITLSNASVTLSWFNVSTIMNWWSAD